MSTDAASVRAVLKAFERDFKAKHGKDPSVDDIKSAGMGACRVVSCSSLHQHLHLTDHASHFPFVYLLYSSGQIQTLQETVQSGEV